MKTRFLDLICIAVLCVVLTLGLWPFHSPRNHVTWLGYCNGLSFGRPGTAIGARPLPTASAESQSASVEIWLQPQRIWDSATFLAFYTPGNPRPFSLRQSLTDLELQAGTAHFYVPNAFRKPRPVFLTITAGTPGTTVYANGALARNSSQFPLSAKDFTGRLILGDSPAQPDNWSGDVLGLAIYRHELSPAQVQRHYETWTRALQPAIFADDRNIALYLFNERAGNTVHDRGGSGIDLDVPEKYLVVDKIFLEPFWKEFSLSRSYWSAAAKNIIGFVPFGFCFYPCLLLHRVRRPAMATVVLGTLVSLTIEILQAYLPTRDSGMTDLFTNAFGTYLGVETYRVISGLVIGKYQTIPIPAPDTVDF